MLVCRKGGLFFTETWCELRLEVKKVRSGKLPAACSNVVHVVVLNEANLAFRAFNQGKNWPYDGLVGIWKLHKFPGDLYAVFDVRDMPLPHTDVASQLATHQDIAANLRDGQPQSQYDAMWSRKFVDYRLIPLVMKYIDSTEPVMAVVEASHSKPRRRPSTLGREARGALYIHTSMLRTPDFPVPDAFTDSNECWQDWWENLMKGHCKQPTP